MQRPRATNTRSHARARTFPAVILSLLLGLSFLFTPGIAAQESTPASGTPVEATPAATPAATPEEEAAADTLGTMLMSYEFEEMPPAPLTVRLLRMTLAPGASVPMHTHPGPEFDLVESGTLTASIDGTAVVSSVIATASGEEPAEVTEEQTLSIGDWIMYPAESGMSLTNNGDEDVVLLSAVIHPVGSDNESTITYTDGEPTDADFDGVSFVVLGDGLIQQFPAGGATVTVDQLTVPAGEPVPGFTGPALLSKTTGTFAISAGEGMVQVTRTANPQLQPNAIPGQEFTLADNDAAFFPAGYEAIERPDSDDSVTFTRLLIQPEGDLATAPAVVNAIQAEVADTTDETADEAPDGGLGIGAIVALSEDAVRVRAEATTDSEIIDSFPIGTRFVLIDGPVEGEDYTWYQVQGVGDLSDVQGWLVTEFMDVIEPATGEVSQQDENDSATTDDITSVLEDATTTDEQPADVVEDILAEEAPQEGTDQADSAQIDVGATVATTEDNLRIRADATTGSDIIVAVPTGTELEVIGGPVEAENFTWFEVQVPEEDVSGWVASDFLEVVEGAVE